MAPRLPAVDIARTLALCGMVAFHAAVDLEMFGHLPAGTIRTGLWPAFARTVAGGFLFLAGVSLVLAHGDGIRWRSFLRRFGVLVLAAATISAATWAAIPGAFVYFGILHSIAACSLIGLAFLRVPAGVTLAVAAGVLAAPSLLRSEVFDTQWLWWLGLSTWTRPSMDYEPVLPWLAPCLAGIAAARLATRGGLWRWLRGWPAGRAGQALAWPGRHSLALYLVHQPVLLALIWLAGPVL